MISPTPAPPASPLPAPHAADLLDSLPYVDYSHPDYEAYAASLMEEEMADMAASGEGPEGRSGAVAQGRLGAAREGFSLVSVDAGSDGEGLSAAAALVRSEYAALIARQGGGCPETEEATGAVQQQRRRQWQPPEDIPASVTAEALKLHYIPRAKVALEAQRSRLTELELQAEFETAVWRYHCRALADPGSGAVEALRSQRVAQSARVDDVNASRKAAQEEKAGAKLSRLERRWEELVGSSSRLGDAKLVLQQEVARMSR